MPIYEYRCRECKKEFEALIWTAEEARQVCCPQCNSKDIERALSCFSKTSGTGEAATSNCGSKTGGFS